MKYLKLVPILLLLFPGILLKAADDTDILLRGILKLGDSQAFSISDTGGTNSGWLKIGQSFKGYTLESFDPETDKLVLSSENGSMEIGLAAETEAEGVVGTTEERLAEAQRMMNLMNFEKMMDDVMKGQMKGMSDMMRQQMATMGVEADEEMIKFQTEAMSRMFEDIDWSSMEKGMTKVYAEVFTKEELEGMSNFYTSPAGKATLEKMPEVQQKTMEVMMPAIMQGSQKFQQEIMQFMKERNNKSAE